MWNIDKLFPEAMELTRISVAVMIVIMLAIGIDLGCGLVKAKARGEVRSSWGLKRTANKVATYEGVLLIAYFIDCLIHFCHFYRMFGWNEAMGVPIITCLLGIFFLVVEVISMFENADKKTKTEINRGSQAISQLVNRDELLDALTRSLLRNIKIKDEITIRQEP